MINVNDNWVSDTTFYGVLAMACICGPNSCDYLTLEEIDCINFVATELKRHLLVTKLGDGSAPNLTQESKISPSALEALAQKLETMGIKNMVVVYDSLARHNPEYINTDAYFYIRQILKWLHGYGYILEPSLVSGYGL